jgi:molybdate transport system permease protein
MTVPDLSALWLTLQLAGLVTLILMGVATPLALWLARTRSRARPVIEALTALPLVLPPTVLGFYLLLAFNPASGLGRFWLSLTGETLTFSFAGLVFASVIYSLPFAVQPLQAGFSAQGRDVDETAASLGAGPVDRFFSATLPLARRAYLTAAVLSFAHTMGEFGVVLMVGGNIPGKTRLISIAIYERVETLDYAAAHALSAILLIFAFSVLLVLYIVNTRVAERPAP